MSKGRWPKTTRMLEVAYDILEQHQPMTVRQVFYHLVGAGEIQNCLGDYQRVSRALTAAREQGEIRFEWIADRSRPRYRPNVFTDTDDYVKVVSAAYRKDYWAMQPAYAEIWSEKDTVMGSIESLTDELGVLVRVARGFNSATIVNEVAQLFGAMEKPVRVFYLGDHDPSGRCAETELYARVQRYGSGPFKMRRLAIHRADIKRYRLPPQLVKSTDPRYAGFVSRYGDHGVELDALPVDVLRRRIREAVEGLMDPEAWDRAVAVEQQELACIKSVVDNWPHASQEEAP